MKRAFLQFNSYSMLCLISFFLSYHSKIILFKNFSIRTNSKFIMELHLLLELYAWNCYSSLAIGLTLNFLLLFVAKKCPSPGLRGYRRVVFYYSVPNISMLILQAINQPLGLADDNNFDYIILNGPIVSINLPILWTISNNVYLLSMNILMAGLGIQFLHRYLVICRNNKHQFFRNIIVALVFLLYITSATAMNLLSIPTNPNFKLTDLNETIFVGAENAIKNIKMAGQFDPENVVLRCFFIMSFTLLIFTYLATIICYWRIKVFLKANMQTDVVHGVKRKTLKNIVWSMLIQAIVSMYPLLLTACIIGLGPIVHIGAILNQFYLLFFALMNWIPVLNPLVTILTIDDYRRGMLGICKKQPQTQTPTVPFVKSQQT